MTHRLRPHLTRRQALQTGTAALAALTLPRAGFAADEVETHGLSIFGDLALPRDFKRLAYVNPDAPKGGALTLQVSSLSGNQNFATFNTLNIHILKGDGAAGMGLIYDSLMSGNADEPDALYGLVARAVRVSADRNTYRFLLRKEARFHDGSPLTAHDVAFSLDILKAKGHPAIRQELRDMESVVAEADDVVTVKLKPGHSREAALIVAGQPILSKAFYSKPENKFEETTLVPPLGSGAYKVGPFEQGRYISFERVKDYWGKDLPINIGQANFDTIRYEYFADRKVAFEAFKAGVFTWREEFTSAVWATGYDFAALRDGKVKREIISDRTPSGTQGWFFNTRRDKFSDPRIREALGLAFDFEWTNANIMYGVYARTISFFQNSPMMAEGKPSTEELLLLEPYRDKLPPAVFDAVYVPPVSDKSGQDRELLRRAANLLSQAGCKREGTALLLPNGKPFDIEFLDFEGSLQPHAAPFIKNLRLLGVEARHRIVDPAQYKRRIDEFDYDIVVTRFGLGLAPGESMRAYFGSESSKMPGTRNMAGIADPVVDALIEKALVAETREQLTIICRAIDRILRARYYWVPMWNKTTHLIAYWDIYGRPERGPNYGLAVASTWWRDAARAQAIGFTGP